MGQLLGTSAPKANLGKSKVSAKSQGIKAAWTEGRLDKIV